MAAQSLSSVCEALATVESNLASLSVAAISISSLQPTLVYDLLAISELSVSQSVASLLKSSLLSVQSSLSAELLTTATQPPPTTSTNPTIFTSSATGNSATGTNPVITTSSATSTNSATSTLTITPTHGNNTPHPKNLGPGEKAGIAIGVLLLFAACVALGYFCCHRRKSLKGSPKNVMDSGLGTNTREVAELPGIDTQYLVAELPGINTRGLVAELPGINTRDLVAELPALSIHKTSSTSIYDKTPAPWYEQPKGDDEMVRLFKEIDGRLTDHVLSFFVVPDDETYGDEVSTLPREVRQHLERRVSKLGYLLSNQESRMFVLRAIIADRIMKGVLEEIQEPASVNTGNIFSSASKHGIQAVGSSSNRIYEFPENTTLWIAQAVLSETSAFAVDKSKSDARLRSIETVVRNAGAFAVTMKRQPTRFELVWLSSSEEEPSDTAAFDPQTMEAAYRVPREGHSGKVRGVVFPGLQKLVDERGRKEERLLLSKIRVLLY